MIYTWCYYHVYQCNSFRQCNTFFPVNSVTNHRKLKRGDECICTLTQEAMLVSFAFLCFFVIVCGTLEYQLLNIHTKGWATVLFIYFMGWYSKKRTTHPVMEIKYSENKNKMYWKTKSSNLFLDSETNISLVLKLVIT